MSGRVNEKRKESAGSRPFHRNFSCCSQAPTGDYTWLSGYGTAFCNRESKIDQLLEKPEPPIILINKLPNERYILTLIVLFGIILQSYASTDVIVSTKLGRVRGSFMQTRLGKNIFAFRGLFYAEPPVGHLRFKDPIPVQPWNNVFDATQEGPACIQKNGINTSENCLTLNIYTKQINNVEVTLPVIVYIHSGRFLQFSGQSSLVGPKYLLDHDVILVTFNYRLGSLGFLNTGDGYAPGNFGLKDQVLALKFVHDHISRFGGDPESVTLAGQSAGARSIVLHMVSPLSTGLFHRAIAMSGSSITPIPPQREQIKLAKKQARLLGCTTDTRREMFKCLREIPAEEFGKTADNFMEWDGNPIMIWYPSVEPKISGIDVFLPDEPEKLMRQGRINRVPLIIGFTKDEYGSRATFGIWKGLQGNFAYFQELNDKWYELAPICFGYESNTDRSRYISDELKKFYFNDQLLTLNNSGSLRRLFANALVHFPVYRTASLISQFSSAPVFLYEFTQFVRNSLDKWPDTRKPLGVVSHADDLQYIFDSNRFPLYNGTDLEVEWVNRWTSIWANFAKTGEPLPQNSTLFNGVIWERLRRSNKKYLNLGKEINFALDRETIKLYDTLFP